MATLPVAIYLNVCCLKQMLNLLHIKHEVHDRQTFRKNIYLHFRISNIQIHTYKSFKYKTYLKEIALTFSIPR